MPHSVDKHVQFLLRAISEPSRMWLVEELLARPGQSTPQLSKAMGISRQAVLQHLSLLRAAGVAMSEKSGRSVGWYVSAESLEPLRTWLDGLLEARET